MTKNKPKNIPQKNPFKILFIIALIGAGLMFFFSDTSDLNFFDKTEVKTISISELTKLYDNDILKTVKIKDNKITAEDFSGKKYLTHKEERATINDLKLNNPDKKATVEIVDNSTAKLLESVLVNAIPILFLLGLIIFISRKAGGFGEGGGPFGFGKSKARIYDKKKHTTKFTDVAGMEEAKSDVEEIVDFLKNPKKYTSMGAKIPKGVLLVGLPGTGKTLLARAIAGEANAPFYAVSGSEFVEMFVGVGASRVRDLFKNAKKNSPSIIFIDEIDAIGKKRGGVSGGGSHDEREQTLNQILTEMDGFDGGKTTIVLAATNRPEVLDKALLRPGRFDRRVRIDLPDMRAREKIMKLHSKNKKLAKNLDFKSLSSKTVGFSGADLESVLNEAAISAAKNREKIISQKRLDDAIEKIAMGPERRSQRITDKEKEIIAYHEAGHAIAGHFTATCEPVHKISIISRGSSLGSTWFLPEEDTYLSSEQKMKDKMVSLHGGRMAEKLIFKETTTGASNDLERISEIARAMVMTYGMGNNKLGPVVFEKKSRENFGLEIGERDYSPETARKIDENVKALVLETEKNCEKALKKHLVVLKKIAKDLLKKETISREEFAKYFK